MKEDKNERGITLIALVITLVVLIILAIITINYLFGESGLLKQAESSNLHTEMGQIVERINLLSYDLLMKNAQSDDKN